MAQEALKTGTSVYDLIPEKKLLSKDKLDEILRPEVLPRPHYVLPEKG